MYAGQDENLKHQVTTVFACSEIGGGKENDQLCDYTDPKDAPWYGKSKPYITYW